METNHCPIKHICYRAARLLSTFNNRAGFVAWGAQAWGPQATYLRKGLFLNNDGFQCSLDQIRNRYRATPCQGFFARKLSKLFTNGKAVWRLPPLLLKQIKLSIRTALTFILQSNSHCRAVIPDPRAARSLHASLPARNGSTVDEYHPSKFTL